MFWAALDPSNAKIGFITKKFKVCLKMTASQKLATLM